MVQSIPSSGLILSKKPFMAMMFLQALWTTAHTSQTIKLRPMELLSFSSVMEMVLFS